MLVNVRKSKSLSSVIVPNSIVLAHGVVMRGSPAVINIVLEFRGTFAQCGLARSLRDVR